MIGLLYLGRTDALEHDEEERLRVLALDQIHDLVAVWQGRAWPAGPSDGAR